MRIKTEFINVKLRHEDWAIMVLPSLFIGRYMTDWQLLFRFLTFEFLIEFYTDENAKNK